MLATMAAFTGTAFGAGADWSLCGAGFRIPERPVSEAAETTADPETIRISADAADLVEEGVSRLTGNVAVERGTRLLRSDEIVYDQPEGIIEARAMFDTGTTGCSSRAGVRARRSRPTSSPSNR